MSTIERQSTDLDRKSKSAQITHLYSTPGSAVATLVILMHVLAETQYLRVDVEGQNVIDRITRMAKVPNFPFASNGGHINSDLLGLLIGTAMQGGLLSIASSPVMISILETTLEICCHVDKWRTILDDQRREHIKSSLIPHCLIRLEVYLLEEPAEILDSLNLAHVCCGALQCVLSAGDGEIPFTEEELQASYPTLFSAGTPALEKYTALNKNMCPVMCQ